MKNKLYYILVILYILMFGLILYINGVFTGDFASISNLVINVGFLLIIGMLFAVSTAGFIRLNQVTDALVFAAGEMRDRYESTNRNLWQEYRKKKDIFPSPVLSRQFGKYQKQIDLHTSAGGSVTGDCALEDYINEDLLDRVGGTCFSSAVSGTLTGLGILGTFLGLTLGMSSFSGNDIFTISDNIAPLLDGMKVAFHTSVYGIFFSLVFTFVYRGIMADAYEKLADFQSAFRECAAPPMNTADRNMSAMLVYQANMANSMKTITEMLRGTAMEQTRGVERIVQQFMEQMAEIMGADFRQLGKTLNQACEAQDSYAQNFARLEESTRLLLEASRAMNNTVNLTLEKQQKIEEKLSRTCDELSNELYTYHQMRDLYEK